MPRDVVLEHGDAGTASRAPTPRGDTTMTDFVIVIAAAAALAAPVVPG